MGASLNPAPAPGPPVGIDEDLPNKTNRLLMQSALQRPCICRDWRAGPELSSFIVKKKEKKRKKKESLKNKTQQRADDYSSDKPSRSAVAETVPP